MLDVLRQDLRYAVRQLIRSPVFTLTASASLAIGIGLAVTGFAVLNHTYLKPLPLLDPSGLYHIIDPDWRPGLSGGSFSYPDYQDFTRSDVFAGLAAVQLRPATVSGSDFTPDQHWLAFVSANYFKTLGVPLARGRFLNVGGHQLELVLEYRTWQNTLSADPYVLGRVLRVNGVPLTVVGVAAASHRGTSATRHVSGWAAVTVLPSLERQPEYLGLRNVHDFALIGRLRPDVTREAARQRLLALTRALAAEHPDSRAQRTGRTRNITLLDERANALRQASAMLPVIAGVATIILMVLLLACTNVAGLLMSRALLRRHEIAVRLTLGASRGRLLAQMLTESMVLASAGGVFGCLVTAWFVSALRVQNVFEALRIDWRVLLAALTISLLCSLTFGLLPALQSLRQALRPALSTKSAGSSAEPGRLRGRLITAQVAVSFLFLLVAISCVRGVRARLAAEFGFDTRGLLTARINSQSWRGDTLRTIQIERTAREKVASMAGIRSVTSASREPASISGNAIRITIASGETRFVSYDMVGPDYFETLGLSVLRGRLFNRSDRAGAQTVAVVNQAFARAFGGEVVGDQFTCRNVQVRIVGVVPDLIDRRLPGSARPHIYLLSEQHRRDIPFRPVLLIKVSPGTEASFASALDDLLSAQFPDLVPADVRTFRETQEASLQEQRITSLVALSAGAIELLLAGLGLYGVLLHALVARTREIGVRLSLGAAPFKASWTVASGGLRYTIYGALIGVLLGLPAAAVTAKLAIGARASDPVPFLFALGVVIITSLVAACVPALRAAGIEPAAALRHE